MRTYDGFGYYYLNENNIWEAKFELSLPNNRYDYEFKNISNSYRNGLTISLKISDLDGGDKGEPLSNVMLDFESLILDLDRINEMKLTGVDIAVKNFKYDRPFYVFIFHDDTPIKYPLNDKECYQMLIDPDFQRFIDKIPAKSGFGSLKRI